MAHNFSFYFPHFKTRKKSHLVSLGFTCNAMMWNWEKNLVQLHWYPLKIRIFFWSFRHPQADKCPFCSAFFCQLRIIKKGFLAQCMPDKLASRPAISIIYGFLWRWYWFDRKSLERKSRTLDARQTDEILHFFNFFVKLEQDDRKIHNFDFYFFESEYKIFDTMFCFSTNFLIISSENWGSNGIL